MNYGPWRCSWMTLALMVTLAVGESWGRAGTPSALRIDTKVRFLDGEGPSVLHGQRDKSVTAATILHHISNVQNDEVPFKEPTETGGFYNRPPGAGRFPVRVEPGVAPYRVNSKAVYPVHGVRGGVYGGGLQSDGTLDSLQQCKCVSVPDCAPLPDHSNACGSGQFLCCSKRSNKNPIGNSEFFNEVEDERPILLPGKDMVSGPFPPPPGVEFNSVFAQEHKVAALLGAADRPVLVGPGGPTGHMRYSNAKYAPKHPGLLVGPEGPTGSVGPAHSYFNKDVGPSATAQRGVLVGPGGPTGVIGPYNQGHVIHNSGGGGLRPNANRGILVGPGGPTGTIGPFRRNSPAGYRRNANPGVLVGPGGPTGIIGPGRQLLVGPGGPTGQIGPPRHFGN